ncbi:MAG TPA: tetratricopeptide repeat protein [Phycisphaerae bacterium]|nr:tetratricopeptide repeat protein [Phycisphaerae bacterium]
MSATPQVQSDDRPTGRKDPPAAQAHSRTAAIIALALIVSAALAIRLLYLHQIQTIPFFHDLVSDAQAYNEWAAKIAGGDWWGDTTFYQAPLYPYFLAAIKVCLGDSLVTVRVVQALLGSLACGLIGLAGWLFLSRRAGLWAAGLLALYPPAIFFDGLIQKTSLGQFLGCALLALIAWTQRRSHPARLLAVGAVLGLLCLARENAIALTPVLAVWAWFCGDAWRRSARARNLLLMLAGVAVILVPVGLRNLRVGGQFALTTFQMGPNFYIGNNPDATGRYQPLVKGHETPEFERRDATMLAEAAEGRTLTPRKVSAFWLGRSWDFIRHRPLDWLMLLGRKWLLVWNFYEIPDSESFYVYSNWSWMLGFLTSLMDLGRFQVGLHFGVLVPLAAGGLVLSWKQRRELWVLYVLLLVWAAAVAVFYVFARYRYPLVPLCVLFAGAAISYVIDRLRQLRWQGPLVAWTVAVAAGALANLPINPRAQLDAVSWGNLGSALARQGQYAAAAGFFERAVQGAPGSPEMHYNLGVAYTYLGRFAEAADHLEFSVQVAPMMSEAHYQLGVARELLGDHESAVRHYRRTLQLAPEDPDARAAVDRLTGENAEAPQP